MLFKKKIDVKIPQHIAFICDGNRRWARKRGMPAVAGYKLGADVVDKSAEFFINHGVSTVSFFLFSTENWVRPADEVKYLMDLMAAELQQHADRAHEKNIRVKIIGRHDRFSAKMIKMFENIEKKTSENTAGTIVMALDYGGQDEILRATNAAIENGKPVSMEEFESFMDSGELLPIDLVVRTSEEQRISNFMLWKLAYAELMFYPKFWPALNEKDYEKILIEYSSRKRRFGK
jgi:undecaprenyl diphosphate synthase